MANETLTVRARVADNYERKGHRFVVVFRGKGLEGPLSDADPHREPSGDMNSPVPIGERDLNNEAWFEYGSRVGWAHGSYLREDYLEDVGRLTQYRCNPELAETLVGEHDLSGLEVFRALGGDRKNAPAALIAATCCQVGPPAHGDSARPPRYAITNRNITITAPA